MRQESRDEEEALFARTVIPPLTDSESEPSSEPDDIRQQLGLLTDGDSSTSLPIPVWLAESSKSFRWGWVPLPLRKAGRATVKWLKGPQPPRDLLLKPLFPRVQAAPVKLLERFVPKRRHKIALLLGWYLCWFLSWSLVLRHSALSGYIEGYGKPSHISCGATYW